MNGYAGPIRSGPALIVESGRIGTDRLAPLLPCGDGFLRGVRSEITHGNPAQQLIHIRRGLPETPFRALADHRRKPSVVMGIHNPRKIPFFPRLVHSLITPEPLLGNRDIGNHAAVPGHAAGIGHGIEMQSPFVRRLRLAGKVGAGTGKRDGVIRRNHRMVRVTALFKHLECDLKRNPGRQAADQVETRLFLPVAPVVSPEHDVDIGGVAVHRLSDRLKPLRIVAAREETGHGARVRNPLVLRVGVVHALSGGPDVLAREDAGFTDKNQSLRAGAFTENPAVIPVEEFVRVRFVRVLVAVEIAVEIDTEPVISGHAGSGR